MRKLFLFFALLLFTGTMFGQYLTESFEGTWAGTPAVPSGWSNIHTTATGGSSGTDPMYWAKNTWSGTAWSSTANGAPTTPTGAYDGTSVAWFNDYNAKATQKDMLITPAIDLSSSTNPLISFYWALNTSSSVTVKLRGSIDGGTTWADIQTLTKPGVAWTNTKISLPSIYKVANVKFGFEVTATYGLYDIWLDKLEVREAVIANAPPSDITFSATTVSGMTVGWTDASSNETSFRVYYSTNIAGPFVQYGSDIPSTTSATVGTTYSQILTGLLDNTTYYFRIVAVTEVESFYLAGSNATLAGTLSGDKPIGPNAGSAGYPSLTAAFADINTNGLAGSVNLILQSDYVSSVETFPIVPSNCASASKTITIYPASSGLSITSANATATIDMNNCKYITFDGRVNGSGASDLVINNTDATAADSRNSVLFRNAATNNTFKYCNIKGRTTLGSVIFFGTSTGTTGNQNNLIDYCNISSDGTNLASCLVYSAGTAGKENKLNIVSNSNLFDFFLEGTSYGIYIGSNSSDWTITNNSFYQTVARTVTTTASLNYPIYITNTSASGGFTVTNNYIGGNAALCAGTPYTLDWVTTARANRIIGIYLNVGTNAVSTVTGNTISNFVLATSSGAATGAGIWCGISVNAGLVNVGSVSNPNTIGSITSNNSIVCTSTTSLGLIVGINSASTSLVNIRYNNIGGFSIGASSTAAIGYTIAGIRVSGGTTGVPSLVISNNTIGSTTMADNIKSGITTTTVLCVATGITSIAVGNNEIKNNTIANLTVSTSNTGNSQVNGISTTNGSNVIEGNTIYALSSNSGNSSLTTPSVVGITNTSTVAGQNINNNTIYNLNNTNATAGIGVTGIQYSSATLGVNLVQRNNIYDLKTTSNSTFALISGIYIGGGTCNVQNNMVTLGKNITNGIDIRGINQPLGSGIKFYFNSVYIDGTATGVNSNTYAFHRAQTSSNCDVNNNIFVNNRTNATSTGRNYAFRIGSTSDYTTPYLICNYNIFNSTVAANMFAVSSTDYDFAAWKGLNPALDPNSIVADPLYVDPTNALPNLHLQAGTPAEGIGLNIAAVTDDFDGQLRANNTPEDIGADAGNFDNTAPTASFVPVNGATGFAVGDNVVVTFSENVRKTDNSAIDGTVVSFKKVSDNSNVPFTANYSNKVLTIDPDGVLAGSTNYSVTISSVEDLSDNALTGSNSTSFTTGSTDFTAPLFDTAYIENAAPSIVVVGFDENIQATSFAGFTITVDGSAATINSYSISTNKILLTLATPVVTHQVVTVEYNATLGNVADVSNNLLATFTAQPVTNGVKSSAKDILTFNFLAADNSGAGITSDINGTINEITNVITLYVPNSVNLTSIIPTITISQYATVNPASGVSNDFTTNLTYTVTAEDLTTQIYIIEIKKVFTIPYFEGFETGHTNQAAISNYWTQAAVTGTNVWTANSTLSDYNRAPRTGTWNAYLKYGNTRWMFSPAIEMEAGKTYTFKIYARQDMSTPTDANITVKYGTGADIASMTNTIVAQTSIINGDYQLITGNFSPATDGVYNVGVLGYMNSTPWYISIDDISIEEALLNDVSSVSVDSKWAFENDTIIPTATVQNNGLNSASFDVDLIIDETDTITTQVSNLASGNTQILTFEGILLQTGNHTIKVITQLSGDENITNDTAVTTYTVIDPMHIAYGYTIYNEADLPSKAPVIIDLNNPQNIFAIADQSADTYTVRGGEWINGNWYAFDRSTAPVNRFIKIDPQTGNKTVLNSTGITYAPIDITFDYTTKTLYGIVAFTGNVYMLYTIDTLTGILTQAYSTTSYGSPITLACNLDGQLFSVFKDGSLYELSKTDTTETLVGSTGITQINYVQSMAFDHRNGDILYWNQQGDGTSGILYTLNTTTGASTLQGNLYGAAEIVGFAIPSPNFYNLTFNVVNGNGSLIATQGADTLTSNSLVAEGSEVVFTADPDFGYIVKEWTLNGNIVNGTSLIYTLSDISENDTVTVEFELATVPTAGVLTFTTDDLGTNTVNPTNNSYDLGDICHTDALTSLTIEVADDNINTATIDVFYDGNDFGNMIYSGNGVWTFQPEQPFNWYVGINTLSTTFADLNGNTLAVDVNFNYVVCMYDVTFNVTDGTSPIEGAVIDITLPDTSLTTNASGVALVSLENGNYTFGVSATNYISQTGLQFTVDYDTVVINIVMTPISVTDIDLNVTLSPNPTNDFVNISANENYTVTVLDVTGRVVSTVQMANNMAVIDLTEQESGMYIVRLSNNEMTKSFKVIRK